MMMPPMMPPELMPGMLFYCNVLLILAKFILPSSWEHAGRRFVQSPAFTVAACLCILVALASFSFQYPGHVEQELGLQEGQVSGFFNSVGLGINKGKHYAIWMFWKFWAGLLYIPLLLPIIFSRHLSYVSYLMVSGHTVLVFLFQVAHESVLNAWLYVTEIHYEHWFVVFFLSYQRIVFGSLNGVCLHQERQCSCLRNNNHRHFLVHVGPSSSTAPLVCLPRPHFVCSSRHPKPCAEHNRLFLLFRRTLFNWGLCCCP
mmetsp:Transcript_34699/g.81115  ORF Transcript_34699/g.81115 Transcript_34699/m.81115 type:complete len:258 (-) Transcript_34699:313-1086(-)